MRPLTAETLARWSQESSEAFLAYAVIGGAKKLWGFAGAKLAERKAARKAGTDAVDVEYTDVEETAEDSDEGNSEK